MKDKISIFIPTHHPLENLKPLLNKIEMQKLKPCEIIIVYSGDKKITNPPKDKKIKLIIIPQKEFSHGRTRNLATKIAKGNLIVFLSHDALPLDENWLSELTLPIKDKIVASFSRQIPKSNAKTTEKFFYNYHFPNDDIIRPTNNIKLPIYNHFFSNVSSCIKKNILIKHPFDENLIMSEDQQFARDVIKAGHKTFYSSKSMVIHSHNYNLKEIFERYFDSALSLKEISNENFKNFTKIGAGYMTREAKFILKNKPLMIPYLIAYNLTKITATTLGIHSNIIPKFIKKKLSMHKKYWD